jgi:hypothetical protein
MQLWHSIPDLHGCGSDSRLSLHFFNNLRELQLHALLRLLRFLLSPVLHYLFRAAPPRMG